MKKFYCAVFVLIILGVACQAKKKGDLPLFIFMSGSPESVPASPDTVVNASGDQGFVVTPLEQTGTTTTSTAPPTNTTGGTTTDTIFTNPGGSTQVQSQINYEVLAGSFQWDNSISTDIHLRIANETEPVANVLVRILEDQSQPGVQKFLSQGSTSSDGRITIRITVTPKVSEIIVNLRGVNPANGKTQEITGRIPIQIPSNLANGGSGGGATGGGSSGGSTGGGSSDPGTVVISPNVVLNTQNFSGVAACDPTTDKDCDGVLDVNDAAPNNASLGWIEESGRFTLAWEDYYQYRFIRDNQQNPNNDMDLNDHVTVFQTKSSFAPDGKVSQIEGIFTMVGKGAGFDHDLRLSLDVPSNVTGILTINYRNGDGTPIASITCTRALSTYSEPSDCVGGTLDWNVLRKGFLILPSSRVSLYSQSNSPGVGGNLNFRMGITSSWKLVFSQPVDLTKGANVMGGHLNYLLAVNGTGELVRRPGFVFEGTAPNQYDRFIDRVSGFPFAVIVPGVFNFPRERVNIMNPSQTGYSWFIQWATSKGISYRNWFETETRVSQNVPIQSRYIDPITRLPILPYTAVLIDAVHRNVFEFSILFITLGLFLGYILRDRLLRILS